MRKVILGVFVTILVAGASVYGSHKTAKNSDCCGTNSACCYPGSPCCTGK